MKTFSNLLDKVSPADSATLFSYFEFTVVSYLNGILVWLQILVAKKRIDPQKYA